MKRSTLLFLGILLLATLYLVRIRYSPGTADAYWHLAVGRDVWQSKTIPANSPYVYGYENTNYISTEWLAGVIFYLSTLTQMTQNSLLAIRIISALLILILLKRTCDLITQNQWLNISAVSSMAFLLGFRFSTDRPEIFTYLFLAFTLYICLYLNKTARISKLTYFLPIIYFCWPNMHALSIVGVGLLAAFVIAAFLQRRFQPVILGTSKARTPESKNFKLFLALCTLSALLAIIQFERFFLFLKVGQVQVFEIKELASLGARLAEIKYGFFTQIPIEIWIYMSALLAYLTLSLFYIRRKWSKRQYAEIFLTFVFFIIILAPLQYYRLITLSLLLVLPQILTMLQSVLKSKKVLNFTAFGVIFISVVLLLVSSLNGAIVGSRNSWQYITNLKTGEIVGVRNRSWVDEYPYKTNKILKYLQTKHLFTSNPWRSYYLWYFPNIKVPSDAIFEYQTKKVHDQEEKIRFGRGNWKDLLAKSGVDTVINSPYESSFTSATPVHQLPGWKLVYIDEIATIYAKENIIKNSPLDLSKIQPELNTQLKFKPENEKQAVSQLHKLLDFDNSNLFARQQLILDLLDNKKDFRKAADLAWASFNIDPRYPYFALYLTKAYSELGNCGEAKTWAGITAAKSFNDVIFKDLTTTALLPCQLQ